MQRNSLMHSSDSTCTHVAKWDIAKLFHSELPQQVVVVRDRNPDRWAGMEIHDGKSVCVEGRVKWELSVVCVMVLDRLPVQNKYVQYTNVARNFESKI